MQDRRNGFRAGYDRQIGSTPRDFFAQLADQLLIALPTRHLENRTTWIRADAIGDGSRQIVGVAERSLGVRRRDFELANSGNRVHGSHEISGGPRQSLMASRTAAAASSTGDRAR